MAQDPGIFFRPDGFFLPTVAALNTGSPGSQIRYFLAACCQKNAPKAGDHTAGDHTE
jgi:hypothetical protein